MATKPPKQWYETLFTHYAECYDTEPYVQGTLGEVDFIESEINFNKKAKILDIACGTGRHSVELAKRRYSVTGIDLSAAMLAKAIAKAKQMQVNIKFQQCNALELPFANEFDLAIMLCAGAFPMMETDEKNYQILQNAYRSLTVGGKFIFTTYNGLYPLCQSVDHLLQDSISEGKSTENQLDLMTFRITSKLEMTDSEGIKHTFDCNERYYMPSEITWQLKTIGFSNIAIFGGKLGAYSRNDQLTAQDYEMLVIAEKR